jgi:hypothetical protein
VADVPSGLSLTPPQETKRKSIHILGRMNTVYILIFCFLRGTLIVSSSLGLMSSKWSFLSVFQLTICVGFSFLQCVRHTTGYAQNGTEIISKDVTL